MTAKQEKAELDLSHAVGNQLVTYMTVNQEKAELDLSHAVRNQLDAYCM